MTRTGTRIAATAGAIAAAAGLAVAGAPAASANAVGHVPCGEDHEGFLCQYFTDDAQQILKHAPGNELLHDVPIHGGGKVTFSWTDEASVTFSGELSAKLSPDAKSEAAANFGWSATSGHTMKVEICRYLKPGKKGHIQVRPFVNSYSVPVVFFNGAAYVPDSSFIIDVPTGDPAISFVPEDAWGESCK